MFADENLINRGGTVNVYKGKLLRFGGRIDVAVRCGPNKADFLEEIDDLSRLKYHNTISIVGFCDETDENIIVVEYAEKGSLDQHLRHPSLTWSQRLEICVGVTYGLYHCSHCSIYREISCSKILLDKDGNPKISCFGLPKKRDPEVLRYSLSLILFQVVYGRKALIGEESSAAGHKFSMGEKLIDPVLRNQIHPLSLRIFLETAYDCSTGGFELERLFDRTRDRLRVALDIQLRHEYIEKNLAHMKIPIGDIESATDNFSRGNLIFSDEYEELYKAELLFLDCKTSPTKEGSEKGELPEGRINVAILCIDYDKLIVSKLFFEGLEMLTSCKHRNIVCLLGFSWEDSRMILVFEYPLFGSLNDCLKKTNKRKSLTWEQRIRISLDIAHGLDCICNMEDKLGIIGQGIMSEHVFLDEEWNVKIVGFNLAEATSHPCEYGYKDGVSICSFGVVLFEILFGHLPDDSDHMAKSAEGLAHIVQSLSDKGTLRKMIDPIILEEAQAFSDINKTGPNQYSLDAFLDIAYQCVNVAKTQAKDPSLIPNREEPKRAKTQVKHLTMGFIIQQLEKALDFQVMSQLENHVEHLKIPLMEIKLATTNFEEARSVGSGAYGKVYKAELDIRERKITHELPNKRKIVAIKRISRREDGQGKEGFYVELEVLSRCEHPNIISLLGYCNEDPEMILVYEHVANGSLDDCLRSNNKNNLTWSQRIKICLDVANGLAYLHSTMEKKKKIIHRDIKSDNILLDVNWAAKIADFGLSKVHPTNQPASTIITNNIAGTNVYLDPEYKNTGKLKKESDIYSFGVVLFEILCGRLAYDWIYLKENEKGLAPIARHHFEEGTLKQMVDPKITEESHEVIANLKIGPSQDSLDAFSKIAYQCVAKTQAERPTLEDIIKELKKASSYQEHRKDIFKIPLNDIYMGTENIHEEKCNIVTGRDWDIHKGEIQYDKSRVTVFVKRLRKSSQEDSFLTELEILYKHKHENVIGVVGYCKEKDEKIIVYEYASKGSLDKCLNEVSLGWRQRLQICIDIAVGLHFLHEGVGKEEIVIHRDIKSSSILLSGDWRAKISDFGLSLITPVSKNMVYAIDDSIGTLGYCEYPLNREIGFLSKESDIYSLGVVLFEILCGKLTMENYNATGQYLDNFVKERFEEGKLLDLVFKDIKETVARESLDTFGTIAYQCLQNRRQERPTAGEVVVQLKKALEIQEDCEIWELKLPQHYTEIIQLSESTSLNSTKSKKDLYYLLTKGILQDDRAWFLGGSNGEITEMVSAIMFSYTNSCPFRLRSHQESRFQKVVEMSDTLNLMIEIKTRTQYLSPNAAYGVYLVFKFCGSSKLSRKRMYVNLKYKMGGETFHAYFATRRDDEWMMVELYQFSSHGEDTDIEFILESFSPSYWTDDAIYVEGIEFRPTVIKHEVIVELQETQQVLKSNLSLDQVQQSSTSSEQIFMRSGNYDVGEKNIQQSQDNGKKDLMLSAKDILYTSSSVNLPTSKSPTQSRLEEIEILEQQVFWIDCNIKSRMLTQDTKYVCYIVFKLSDTSHGLHCPVKVRDLLHKGNNEGEILYFVSPSPWNKHIAQVPQQREDGWMEVNVWKFYSNHELENDCVQMNLKLMSFEGTMSGLIIRGIEFRPL